ncbi:MAG: TOBE domain-containing protein, partial [Gammaproteobacteria bacterium]|nr:TOBE domain-containing protein [Gammaproteobacteria bacterium]
LGFVTSMRNQFPCTVDSVSEHGASVRVGLELASGAVIYSRITRESAELLGLKSRTAVLALFKATGVKVAAEIPARDGYNLLPGQVSQVAAFDDEREIGLALSPELRLTGFAEHGAQLAEGDSAMASIEESSVVIAISG